MRARYYDSLTVTFTQEDPIKDGNNWYSYCMGNPVVFTDPSGLKINLRKILQIAAIAAVTVVAVAGVIATAGGLAVAVGATLGVSAAASTVIAGAAVSVVAAANIAVGASEITEVITENYNQLDYFLPIENTNRELISEPYELEIGTLKFISGSKNFAISEKQKNELSFIHNARNRLAHNKILSYNEVGEILNIM